MSKSLPLSPPTMPRSTRHLRHAIKASSVFADMEYVLGSRHSSAFRPLSVDTTSPRILKARRQSGRDTGSQGFHDACYFQKPFTQYYDAIYGAGHRESPAPPSYQLSSLEAPLGQAGHLECKKSHDAEIFVITGALLPPALTRQLRLADEGDIERVGPRLPPQQAFDYAFLKLARTAMLTRASTPLRLLTPLSLSGHLRLLRASLYLPPSDFRNRVIYAHKAPVFISSGTASTIRSGPRHAYNVRS